MQHVWEMRNVYTILFGLPGSLRSPTHSTKDKITRLERYRPSLRSTIKFQRCYFRYITADDVSRATKWITNATVLSKVIVAMWFRVTVVTLWWKTWQTDRQTHGRVHKVLFVYAKAWRWVLKEENVGMWIGLRWLKLWTGGGLLCTLELNFRLHESLKFLD
jgi:hypothetical protein